MKCEKCGEERKTFDVVFQSEGKTRYRLCSTCMINAPVHDNIKLLRWLKGEDYDTERYTRAK